MISSSEILPAKDAPSPRRIYVASPLSTYSTKRYDRMLGHITTSFPEAKLLPARSLYASNRDWLCQWPDVLNSIDAVVVFTDEGGWVGHGVWTELSDAALAGLPVWIIRDDGALFTLDGAQVVTIDEDDWRQYALLHLPDALASAEVR